jgi:Fe2+ transport system protein B
MATTDTDFLKERIQKKKALETQDTTVSNDATQQLKESTEDIPDLKEQIRQRRLQKQAQKLGANDEEIAQNTADKEAQIKAQTEKEIEDKRIANEGTTKERARLAGQKTGEIVDTAGKNASALVDRVSSLKTTGGISLLLVIIVILMFVVVQVNSAGDTRLKQLWYMLNGRTNLKGKVTLTGSTGGGGGDTGGYVAPGSTIVPGIIQGGIGAITGITGLSYRTYTSI